MEEYVALLKSSYQNAIDNKGEKELAKLFFDKFFEIYPETTQFFEESDLDYFRKWKMNVIFNFILDIIQHYGYAETYITTEVIRHQSYGLKDKEYYFTLVTCLYEAVKASADQEHWNSEIDGVWNEMILAFKALVGEAADAYL